MAFPPNFTNVWDSTFPPDTQLANLLGQDIRNLKTDIMQRMSLLSGTFANRPTPEIVNAVWGGAGFGLLYFSTDTAQIFQWNGAAWVDITSTLLGAKVSVLFKDNAAHINTGNIAENTIYTIPIAANSLGLSGVLRGFVGLVINVQPGGLAAIRVRLGGSLLVAANYGGATGLPCLLNFEIGNRGVANSQIAYAQALENGVTVVTLSGTSVVDTTVIQNLTITVQSANNGDSQTFNQCFVEQL